MTTKELRKHFIQDLARHLHDAQFPTENATADLKPQPCGVCLDEAKAMMPVIDRYFNLWLEGCNWESASILARWWRDGANGS